MLKQKPEYHVASRQEDNRWFFILIDSRDPSESDVINKFKGGGI